MKKFHETLKKNADAVRLTDAQRARMRAAFLMHMREHPAAAPSPYPFSFIAPFSLSLRSGIAFALAVLVVGAGGTAYAAEDALPGDTLYAVKVGVNEPVAGALAVTPAAKGAWHAQVAETRLAEAQTLVSEGRLTASTSDELAADFTEHASRVDEIAASLQASDPDASARLSGGFSAALALRGTAILRAGDAASSTDRSIAARLVRAAVGTQSSELAMNDAHPVHAPVAAKMMRAQVQAPKISPAARVSESSDEDAADASAPQPQAKMMATFSAPLAAPAATDTDEEPQASADAHEDGGEMAHAAAFAPAAFDEDGDSDAALDQAIGRAADALDDARDSLDASTTAAFDAKLSDLRLVPLAVAADAAAGDTDSISNDRLQGVRSANALSASIRAALRDDRNNPTISAPADGDRQP